MIRREQGNDWLILLQTDHARVAGELAAAWRHSPVGASHTTDLLIETVWDHDVGWREWEAAPEVNPQTGIPRAFTEMPMETAVVIWEKSITYCSRKHPLPGIWVSSHFCRLAERVLINRKDEPEGVEAAQQFLDEQKVFQNKCRTTVLEVLTQRELESLSTFGVWFLRMFDGLSLWLCCAERSQPMEMRFQNQVVKFVPNSATTISLEPYVLTKRPLVVTVPVRRIDARTYESNEEFQAILSEAPVEELNWTFE